MSPELHITHCCKKQGERGDKEEFGEGSQTDKLVEVVLDIGTQAAARMKPTRWQLACWKQRGKVHAEREGRTRGDVPDDIEALVISSRTTNKNMFAFRQTRPQV